MDVEKVEVVTEETGVKQVQKQAIGSSAHALETRVTYRRYFRRFLDHIKIHDTQGLLDMKPKILTQMIIDYVDFLR